MPAFFIVLGSYAACVAFLVTDMPRWYDIAQAITGGFFIGVGFTWMIYRKATGDLR